MLASNGESGRPLRASPPPWPIFTPVDHDPGVEVAADRAEGSAGRRPCRATRAIRASWFTRSKNRSRSTSTTQVSARLDRPPGGVDRLVGAPCPAGSRSCGPRRRVRRSGDRTWLNACWRKRSSTVGTPSSRSPPPGLGIVTRRTGAGRYVPASSCARTSGQCGLQTTAGARPWSCRRDPGRRRCASTRRSARARLSRERKTLPQVLCRGRGERLGVGGRRIGTALCSAGPRASPVSPRACRPTLLGRDGCGRRADRESSRVVARTDVWPFPAIDDPRRYCGRC